MQFLNKYSVLLTFFLLSCLKKCSSGVASAKRDCENGINGAKSSCERELRKIDPTDDIINFGKDAVRTIGDGFRRVFGKKRKRRAMTDQEKEAIELAKQLVVGVKKRKQPKNERKMKGSRSRIVTPIIAKVLLESIGSKSLWKRKSTQSNITVNSDQYTMASVSRQPQLRRLSLQSYKPTKSPAMYVLEPVFGNSTLPLQHSLAR